METRTRLEITNLELAELDKNDFKWAKLNQFYLVNIIKKANELGLKGRKIKEVVGVTAPDDTNSKYIDFICEEESKIII